MSIAYQLSQFTVRSRATGTIVAGAEVRVYADIDGVKGALSTQVFDIDGDPIDQTSAPMETDIEGVVRFRHAPGVWFIEATDGSNVFQRPGFPIGTAAQHDAGDSGSDVPTNDDLFDVLYQGVPPTPGDAGKIVMINGSGKQRASNRFDVFPIMVDNAGKFLRVNSGETAPEWVDPPGGGASYPPFAGNAGKHLAVNPAEDGVGWVAPPSGGGSGDPIVWTGARFVFSAFNPSVATWTAIPGGTEQIDIGGFYNDAGGFVIPAGVNKVRLRAFVQQTAGAAIGNQWVPYKNASAFAQPNGGFRGEIDVDGYNNGGDNFETGALSVVEGDVFTLVGYVSATGGAWAGWFEIEVLEGSILGTGPEIVLPVYGAGDAGKVLTINETEDGLEWADPPAGGGGLITVDTDWSFFTFSRTATATDHNRILEPQSSNNLTFFLPDDTAEAIPVGTLITLVRRGTGALAVEVAGAATVNGGTDSYRIAGQFGAASIYKRAADSWIITGQVEIVV